METGACPSCGRLYNPDLETRVERLAQEPGVIRRARRIRFSLVAVGLGLVALVFVLHRFGMRPSELVFLIVTGATFAVGGAFYTPQKQARAELTKKRE